MVQNRIRWCVAADLGLGAPAVLMLMGVHSMQSVSLLQPPLPPPLLLLLRRRLNSKQASTQSPAWSHPPKRIIWPVLHCVRLWRHRAEGEGCAAASTAASCVHWHCIGKTQHTHTHTNEQTPSQTLPCPAERGFVGSSQVLLVYWRGIESHAPITNTVRHRCHILPRIRLCKCGACVNVLLWLLLRIPFGC